MYGRKWGAGPPSTIDLEILSFDFGFSNGEVHAQVFTHLASWHAQSQLMHAQHWPWTLSRWRQGGGPPCLLRIRSMANAEHALRNATL